MAIGNIVGSNIFNTAMILGITAMISPLIITKSNLKKDIPLNILVTVLLIALGMNFTLIGLGKDQLSRIDGIILLGIFAWYLWSSFRSDSADDEEIYIMKKFPFLEDCPFELGTPWFYAALREGLYDDVLKSINYAYYRRVGINEYDFRLVVCEDGYHLDGHIIAPNGTSIGTV